MRETDDTGDEKTELASSSVAVVPPSVKNGPPAGLQRRHAANYPFHTGESEDDYYYCSGRGVEDKRSGEYRLSECVDRYNICKFRGSTNSLKNKKYT